MLITHPGVKSGRIGVSRPHYKLRTCPLKIRAVGEERFTRVSPLKGLFFLAVARSHSRGLKRGSYFNFATGFRNAIVKHAAPSISCTKVVSSVRYRVTRATGIVKNETPSPYRTSLGELLHRSTATVHNLSNPTDATIAPPPQSQRFL